MSEARKNRIITLDIADMNNLGYGIGRHGGIVVFVRGAVPGDLIECRIIKINKNYLVGRVEKLISPSPHRVSLSFCEAPESCGGCVYRNIEYDYELELKRNFVLRAFRQAGLGDVKIGTVRSTGVTLGYRNKAQFPVGRRADGSLYTGFYAAGTHRIAGDGRHNCSLHPAVFSDIARDICAAASEYGVTAYDEDSGRGLLRHIYLRRGDISREIMVCIVICGDDYPGIHRLARELTEKYPDITGVLLNKNKKKTNVVLGDEYVTVLGRDYIEDTLCGLRFRITPDSFYQVNHNGAELLYSIARQKAAGDDSMINEKPRNTFVDTPPKQGRGVLLDLYCGTGTIGLSMARDFDEVIGVEIVPSAVECALDNAMQNAILNASFYCGDASDAAGFLGTAERERGGMIEASTVILDPPRKGSTPELIKYISKRGIERVVYVSCAPDTLARDCALFRELGYLIGEVTPVDMFPRTGHVETVVLITRNM